MPDADALGRHTLQHQRSNWTGHLKALPHKGDRDTPTDPGQRRYVSAIRSDTAFADRSAPAPKRAVNSASANDILQSEPRGDRTHDPRLKRPGQLGARGGKGSQALATARHFRGDDSTRHPRLAGFSLSFAAHLLTAREVAAFLRVSTRTVYTLCDQGRLAHVRVMNAIRVEAAAVIALVRSRAE